MTANACSTKLLWSWLNQRVDVLVNECSVWSTMLQSLSTLHDSLKVSHLLPNDCICRWNAFVHAA